MFVPKNLGNPYFDAANTGAHEVAAELGVTVTYLGSAAADATEQIPIITNATAQGVDAIMISNNTGDLIAPAAQAARNAGITVVTWDSLIPSAEGEQFEAGRMGTYAITQDPIRDVGLRVLMGPFSRYNPENIDAALNPEYPFYQGEWVSQARFGTRSLQAPATAAPALSRK